MRSPITVVNVTPGVEREIIRSGGVCVWRKCTVPFVLVCGYVCLIEVSDFYPISASRCDFLRATVGREHQ